MALVHIYLVIFLCLSSVISKPFNSFRDSAVDYARLPSKAHSHRVFRRFIDPDIIKGDDLDFRSHLGKPYRTARSVESECEKLRLCKLHASGPRSLLASYELYFVNKENAKLWDHQTHSMSDCERLYGDCYGGRETHAAPETEIEFINSDYY